MGGRAAAGLLGEAAEGGRAFPVAKRAAADADREGGLFLCPRLAEQPRRPPLLARSLLSAAALVGELLLGSRPWLPAAAGSESAVAGGGLGDGAGAGGSLDRGGPAERLAHLRLGQPVPAGASTPPGEVAVQLLGDRVRVPTVGIYPGRIGLGRREPRGRLVCGGV